MASWVTVHTWTGFCLYQMTCACHIELNWFVIRPISSLVSQKVLTQSMNLQTRNWRRHMRLKRRIIIEAYRFTNPSHHHDAFESCTFRGASRRSVSYKKFLLSKFVIEDIEKSGHTTTTHHNHTRPHCDVASNKSTENGAQRKVEAI